MEMQALHSPSLTTVLTDGNFPHLRCNFVALWPNQLPYQLGQREEYPKDWLQVPAHKNPIPDALFLALDLCFGYHLDFYIHGTTTWTFHNNLFFCFLAFSLKLTRQTLIVNDFVFFNNGLKTLISFVLTHYWVTTQIYNRKNEPIEMGSLFLSFGPSGAKATNPVAAP